MAAVDIFADITNRQFVQSAKGVSQKGFSSPFHQDKLYFRLNILAISPLGSLSSEPAEVLDAAAFTATLLVVKTDGTVLAGPMTTWSVDDQAKVGSVDLNTAAMVTAFTNAATLSVDAYIFLQLDDGANVKTTIQAGLTIKRSYITGATPTENPLDTYLTRAECLALFVKFAGNPDGASITLPNGGYSLILKCNADGSNASDSET